MYFGIAPVILLVILAADSMHAVPDISNPPANISVSLAFKLLGLPPNTLLASGPAPAAAPATASGSPPAPASAPGSPPAPAAQKSPPAPASAPGPAPAPGPGPAPDNILGNPSSANLGLTIGG